MIFGADFLSCASKFTIFFVLKFQLDYHKAVLQSEEKNGAAALEKSLGVSSYLKTVKQQQYLGQSADPCPICKTALQDNWGILPCGHCYCLECLGSLLANVKRKNHYLQNFQIFVCFCRIYLFI